MWSPLFRRSPSLVVRLLAYLLFPLFYFLSVSENQCGECLMYGLYRCPAGFSCVGEKGDVVQGYLGTDEEIEKMWDYACNRPGVPYKQ